MGIGVHQSMDLTDAQWALLGPLFRPKRRADGRGRPWRDARRARRGAVDSAHRSSLADLPEPLSSLPDLPSPVSAVAASGALFILLQKLAEDLRDRGKLDLSEAFVDGSFSEAKKGLCMCANRRGKGSNIMAIADRHGLPLAVHVEGAGAHEVGLVEATLRQRFLSTPPQRLIGDKAYDSDALDQRLRETLGVQLISPTAPLEPQQARHPRRPRAASLPPPLED